MTDYLSNIQKEVEAYFYTSCNIPPYFYQCLFGELIKVFGIHLIIPDPNYLAEYDDDGNMLPSNNDDYSYQDQIGYYLTMLTGTFGWNDAFQKSCEQCNQQQLFQDYKQMDWMKSDIFDGCIVDKMVEVLFDEKYPRGYYNVTYGV